MCADKYKKTEEYAKTRKSFDDLGVEEQAVFIVESAVNMIVKSVQKAGDAFSKAFDEMKHEEAADSTDESETDAEADGKATKTKAKPGSAKKSSSKGSKSKSSPKPKSE